jgi:drug/metabolite transporter (DMT)-like permease
MSIISQKKTIDTNKMKQQRRSASSQEAVATLDPLLPSFDDQINKPVYHTRRSSIFYIPATTIHESNTENLNPNKRSDCLTKCLSYTERFSGIMYGLLAALLFSCSNFMLKQFDVILLDVYVVRLAAQGLLAFGYIMYKGYHPFSSNSHGLLTFVQAVMVGIGNTCLYVALTLLPLPDYATIRNTQVVWTAILAFIIFRERITLSIIVACILTFIGVTFIAQPTFLFPKIKTFNETLQISVIVDNEKRLFGMFTALACAFSLSISVLLNKKLLQKKLHQSIILFYSFLSTFILLLIIQTHYWVFSETNHHKFDIKKIYLTKSFISATSLAILQIIPLSLAQKAMKREHSSIVTVMQATEILFAIILQNIFSIKKSNSITIIGSTLVLTSIIILCAHKLWQDRYNRTPIPTINTRK